MQYEETAPYTRVKPKAQAKAILRKANSDINHMSSLAIGWHLLKRHKMGLLVTTCLLQGMALLGVLPILFDLIRH